MEVKQFTVTELCLYIFSIRRMKYDKRIVNTIKRKRNINLVARVNIKNQVEKNVQME